jgi:cytochrome d ubiquinol oxidase subunit I
MSQVALARIQFGGVTIYHFLFVPITIGLAFMLAILETRYWKNPTPQGRQTLNFFGRLFLINFAVGVVTGIFQEFQFGMNWSNYSRFVGDIFGAPLAVEALAAFFLESTFLGVWIFGWDRVSPRIHVWSMWLVAIGSSMSAFWILAANAWMQEPVGYKIVHGRAEMTNFWAIVTNPQLVREFPHTEIAALATGAFFLMGISAYFLSRRQYTEWFEAPFKIALIVAAIASVLVIVIGSEQASHLIVAQPMKMAAAEALWKTSPLHAPWTLFSIFNPVTGHAWFSIKIPDLLSILAYNRFSGRVLGITVLQHLYVHRYGPGFYVPPVLVTFWSFRIMILIGFLMAFVAIWGVWLMHKGRLLQNSRYLRMMVWAIGLPSLANIMGWVMTEVGRQPWIVFGLQRTVDGISPTVSATEVWITLIGFFVLYTIMGIVEVSLLIKFVRLGPEAEEPEPENPDLSLLQRLT